MRIALCDLKLALDLIKISGQMVVKEKGFSGKYVPRRVVRRSRGEKRDKEQTNVCISMKAGGIKVQARATIHASYLVPKTQESPCLNGGQITRSRMFGCVCSTSDVTC